MKGAGDAPFYDISCISQPQFPGIQQGRAGGDGRFTPGVL